MSKTAGCGLESLCTSIQVEKIPGREGSSPGRRGKSAGIPGLGGRVRLGDGGQGVLVVGRDLLKAGNLAEAEQFLPDFRAAGVQQPFLEAGNGLLLQATDPVGDDGGGEGLRLLDDL